MKIQVKDLVIKSEFLFKLSGRQHVRKLWLINTKKSLEFKVIYIFTVYGNFFVLYNMSNENNFSFWDITNIVWNEVIFSRIFREKLNVWASHVFIYRWAIDASKQRTFFFSFFFFLKKKMLEFTYSAQYRPV